MDRALWRRCGVQDSIYVGHLPSCDDRLPLDTWRHAKGPCAQGGIVHGHDSSAESLSRWLSPRARAGTIDIGGGYLVVKTTALSVDSAVERTFLKEHI